MTASEVQLQVRAYEGKHEQFEGFTQALKGLLTQLIAAKNIELANIEARTKTVESFRGKIEREDKNYSDPINQITDLAAVRIITYQLADVDLVGEIIDSNLKIDRPNSIDKRQSLEVDRFGYVSVHYIVSLDNTRAGLPEYAAFSHLRGEIQIRTVLQHAWAAIDHKLRYKNKQEIPVNLRRQLYRISALLETADEEFESLKNRIVEVRDTYSKAIAAGTLDIPLNVESLSVYVEGNSQAQEILTTAEQLGIAIAPHPANAKLPEYSQLLMFLDHADILKIQDVDQLIASLLRSNARSVLSKVLTYWRETVAMPGLRLVVTRDSLLRMIVLLALPPDRASKVVDEWESKIENRVLFGYALGDAVEKTFRELHNAPNFHIRMHRLEDGTGDQTSVLVT